MLRYAESCCATLLPHRCFLQGRKCREMRVFDISDAPLFPLYFSLVFTGRMDGSCFLSVQSFLKIRKRRMPNFSIRDISDLGDVDSHSQGSVEYLKLVLKFY